MVHLPGRDERRDELDQRWPALLEQHGYTPIAVPNLLQNPDEWLRALDISMIILTGGNDLQHLEGAVDVALERDATESRLIAHAVRRELPLLGVCRGMQMMVCHFGGRLTRGDGHVGTTHSVAHASATMAIPLRDSAVNSFHNWVVPADGLPNHFRILATAADGTVEAMHHSQLPHAGVMWHPERAPYDPVDMQLIDFLLTQGPT